MEFKLVDTQEPDENNDNDYDDDDGLSSEDNEYNDIYNNKKQPVISSVDKKRDNKTVECPKCGRKMNLKTYKYSHKCPTAKANENTKSEIELSKSPQQQKTINPTKQDIHTMIQEQERVRRQLLIQQKQEKMNKLLSRAF